MSITSARIYEFGPQQRFEAAVLLKTSTLPGADCQEVIDVSDVDNTHGPNWTLDQWRDMVSECVIDNARDGEIWAIDWVQS